MIFTDTHTHLYSKEFEKYRIVQDRLYESDFDKAIKTLNKNRELA